MSKPYWKSECAIHCCENCVPPKRHVGCHSTCEDYLIEKAEWEQKKELIKEDKKKNQRISAYDFQRVSYVNVRGRKKK